MEADAPQATAARAYFGRLRQILTKRDLKTMLRTYRRMEQDPDAGVSRAFRAVQAKINADPQAQELSKALVAAREVHSSEPGVSWEELVFGNDESGAGG